MRTRFVVAAVVAVGACWAATESAQPHHSEPVWQPTKPVLTWAGSYSAIGQREYYRITDDTAWSELWNRHIGDHAERDSYGEVVVPRIDFDRFMVIAVFNGDGWNTRSMYLAEQTDTTDELRIRFDAASYQTSTGPAESDTIIAPPGAAPDDIARLAMENLERHNKEREANKQSDPNYTRAYCMCVMPRTAKPLVLLENTQGLKNEPAKWTERQRFAPVRP